MPERDYPTMVGSSLLPVGLKGILKATGKDTPIPQLKNIPPSLLAEAIMAIGGSVAVFMAKRPWKTVGAGVGIGGIVLTVNDIIELYAFPEGSSPSESSASSLDEYVKRYGG